MGYYIVKKINKLKLQINTDECQSNVKKISKSQNIHRMIHLHNVYTKEKSF